MKRLFLGGDVSKGYIDIHIEIENGNVLIENQRYYDNRAGHNKLLTLLNSMFANNEDEAHCGFESTGGYENNWIRTLYGFDSRIKVYRINPVRIHHQSKSELTRSITDPVAAKIICNHLRLYYNDLKTITKDDEKNSNSRKMYKYIVSLQKSKTQNINQLKHVLYSSIPELLIYAKEGIPKWILQLLIQFPSRDKLIRARVKTVAKLNGITFEKATKIKKAIKLGVGTKNKDDQSIEYLIKRLSNKILNIQKEIDEAKQMIDRTFNHPMVEILTSIEGIGKYTATCIILEIEGIEKFPNASKLASFFGVHPQIKQSGDAVLKSRMSKKGRSSYRSIIYMAARNVIMYNSYFKALYEKHKANGKSFNEAIGVVMHKLTRIIFGMMKSGNKFDEKVLKGENRKIESPKVEKILKNKKMKIENKTDPRSLTSQRYNTRRGFSFVKAMLALSW